VILQGLISPQLVKKFPAFYGTLKFIAVFTTDGQFSPVLSQTNQLHIASSSSEEQLYYYLPIDKVFQVITLFNVSLRPYV